MRPAACTLLIAVLIFVLTRPGASARNATLHAGGLQPWDINFLSPHLWQTDVQLQMWRIIAAFVCGAMAAALSSAGGVGGGGLYVPIINLLLGLSSKTSAALSSCMILGGTFVNLVWYTPKRRPDNLGPLVDYQVFLLCLPTMLLGNSLGVICNVASPSWLVTIILIIILFFMTFRSCRIAVQLWCFETSAMQADSDSPVSVKDNGCVVSSDKDARDDSVISPLSHKSPHDSYIHIQDKDLEKPLLEPQINPQIERLRQYPPLKIASLGITWIVFLAVQIVRGSSDGQNFFGIETCGTIYWIVTFLQVPFAIIVAAWTLIYFQRKTNADVMENNSFEGRASMKLLPIYAVITGFLGGMLGLGGGMIISPLLLELGMHPQVTAATCSYMVFFSSSLSVIQYWLLGRIPEDYALISAALSFVFSAIGLLFIQTIITKFGRVSLIVFSVSTVMGISAALMAFFGLWDVITQIQQGAYMGFQSPC